MRKLPKSGHSFKSIRFSTLLTESNRPILKLRIRIISRILSPIRTSLILVVPVFVTNNIIGYRNCEILIWFVVSELVVSIQERVIMALVRYL